MSESTTPPTPPPLPTPVPAHEPAPSPERTLRRLFLTLFLRGRSSRGIRKDSVPKSVATRLSLALFMYACLGLIAVSLLEQPLYSLSLYLHGATLLFVGMFFAASAGEVLFNKEEADILLHRPIAAETLLWAKIGIMVQVALWLAGAFNLAGLFVGVANKQGGWLYPPVHALSTFLAALFCASAVVMIYQLCLRWFGREKLDAIMTTAQVLVAVTVVAGSQLLPQLMVRSGATMMVTPKIWWIWLVPPAWFAGIDDALAGGGDPRSWILAGVALTVTGAVLWLAFRKLAQDYQTGLQTLSETVAPRPRQQRVIRRLGSLVNARPLRWWLHDPVERASFMLTAAYLLRDRDVKLRVYPGLAPMLVLPFIFLIQSNERTGMGSFGVAFAGTYLGYVPMLALDMLRNSQQWQAADLFRVAPIAGPAPLYHGARRAVLLILTLPALILFACATLLFQGGGWHFALAFPGLIALPVFALVPCLGGNAVPLSLPPDEAKSAGRGIRMIGVMLIAALLAGLAAASWDGGWFLWFLLVEAILALCIYAGMQYVLANTRWPALE